jgi:hypothetical protein
MAIPRCDNRAGERETSTIEPQFALATKTQLRIHRLQSLIFRGYKRRYAWPQVLLGTT